MVLGTLASAPGSAHASNDFYGVVPQTSLSAVDLSLMKSGGIGSIRLSVSSGSVNPSRGVFDWTELDKAVRLASKYGLSTLPAFYGSPSWIDSDFRSMPDDPDSMAQWDLMLTEAVRRYGSDGSFWLQNPRLPKNPIETWQIWNEPNAKWFATQPISARRYAELLIESAKTIRSEDNQAKIMIAGLFPSPDDDEEGMRGAKFLENLYGVEGFKNSFDYMAVHPYASTFEASIGHLIDIRDVMQAAGDGDKGLYVTEVGWGSDSRTGMGMESQAGQADRLTIFYATLLASRTRLKLRGVYWFAWRDPPANIEACGFCYGAGLLDQDGVPKLAWSALTDFIGLWPLEERKSNLLPCVAPNVVSLKVVAARRAISRSNCGIHVTTKKQRKSRRRATGRVHRQWPKPMSIWPGRTVVKVVVLRRKGSHSSKGRKLGSFRSGRVDGDGYRPSP